VPGAFIIHIDAKWVAVGRHLIDSSAPALVIWHCVVQPVCSMSVPVPHVCSRSNVGRLQSSISPPQLQKRYALFVECVFSTTGIILNSKRCMSSEDKQHRISFVYDNVKFCLQGKLYEGLKFPQWTCTGMPEH